MEVKAHANNIRMSPRKVRLVIDVIRGMDATRAQTQLRFIKKAAALPVLKLLNSAIANAEHNFQLRQEDLRVMTITADGGPVIHRWTPKAFGRSAPIRKRTSHITVILSDDGKGGKKKPTKADAKPAAKTAKKAPAKKAPAKKSN